MRDEYDEESVLDLEDDREECVTCGVKLDRYQVMLFDDDAYCAHCFPYEDELEDI